MIIDYMLVNVGVRLSETLAVQTHSHYSFDEFECY